ncbi:hypothetical protein FGO68_gene9305 [Halteria grandinella]|uniref:Uncharacterized protein n=1 Tax=Halteria grandinella TaxID=5974 RepID=A0A8J8NTF7_HALGN|nr:hypothetical protein FGO68_gene9305 [Halteria grandinella]
MLFAWKTLSSLVHFINQVANHLGRDQEHLFVPVDAQIIAIIFLGLSRGGCTDNICQLPRAVIRVVQSIPKFCTNPDADLQLLVSVSTLMRNYKSAYLYHKIAFRVILLCSTSFK